MICLVPRASSAMLRLGYAIAGQVVFFHTLLFAFCTVLFHRQKVRKSNSLLLHNRRNAWSVSSPELYLFLQALEETSAMNAWMVSRGSHPWGVNRAGATWMDQKTKRVTNLQDSALARFVSVYFVWCAV